MCVLDLGKHLGDSVQLVVNVYDIFRKKTGKTLAKRGIEAVDVLIFRIAVSGNTASQSLINRLPLVAHLPAILFINSEFSAEHIS